MESIDYEALRQRLLDEAYVMAFSGLEAATLDAGEIERADYEHGT